MYHTINLGFVKVLQELFIRTMTGKTDMIKQLVESAIREAMMSSSPEATRNDPYEEYLFGDSRDDVEEPDTESEASLYHGIQRWIDLGIRSSLRNHLPRLRYLRDQGKYSIFLDPPKQLVWRGMYKVPVETAAQLFGITETEVREASIHFDEHKDLPDYNPFVGFDSWSVDEDVATRFAHRGGDAPGFCRVILETHTSQGDFVLNPYTLAKVVGDFQYDEEQEVILCGPTKVNRGWLSYE